MIHIIQPGPLSTIQDLGRPQARRYGVPTGGAMDRFALAAANRLVGNDPGAAAIEITAGGAAFVAEEGLRVALCGADLDARIDGRAFPRWCACEWSPGIELRFGGRKEPWGARSYLAVAGGIAVPAILGSRSALPGSALPGLAGRALRAGDRLAIERDQQNKSTKEQSYEERYATHWSPHHRPAYRATPRLRVVAGPHCGSLAEATLAAFYEHRWEISATSNRMGYRLAGPPLTYHIPAQIVSFGVVPGVVQLPPNGQPILLMADAQTTGGYPVIATVIAPDLPLAAQLLPGDRLSFRMVTLDEAYACTREYADWERAGLEIDEGAFQRALAGA
jgi:biotin-dependent carboxylase-like uncharacterized protein